MHVGKAMKGLICTVAKVADGYLQIDSFSTFAESRALVQQKVRLETDAHSHASSPVRRPSQVRYGFLRWSSCTSGCGSNGNVLCAHVSQLWDTGRPARWMGHVPARRSGPRHKRSPRVTSLQVGVGALQTATSSSSSFSLPPSLATSSSSSSSVTATSSSSSFALRKSKRRLCAEPKLHSRRSSHPTHFHPRGS